MATKITFEANGREYKLEMNAATVKRLERSGFDFSNIGARQLNAAEDLFVAAFEMHHPSVRRDQRLDMFRALNNYGAADSDIEAPEISEVLFKMAAEAIDNVKPSGNVGWKVEK